jgi:5-methylcytosine-specific restriction endonuclease McrA
MGERYCKKHIRGTERPAGPKPFENAVRANDSLYNTARWRKLKGKVLKAHPYCFKCGISKSETTLHVHHLIEPRGNEELFFDETNLVPVCDSCHRVLTAQEIRNRRKKIGN